MNEETKELGEDNGIPYVTLKLEGRKWVARNAAGKIESRRDRKRDVLRAMKARGYSIKEETTSAEHTNGVT